MSVRNRVGSKIEAVKLKIEETIEMKLDDLKADHMKTIDSLDTKPSDINVMISLMMCV